MNVPSPRVTSHSSEAGSWEMVERAAYPALRGITSPYTGYTERSPGPFRRRETPGSRIVLILSLGPEIRIAGADSGRGGRTHGSFVAGLHERAVVTEHDGTQLGVQIDLPPIAARMLLGLPLKELANEAVPLDDILGSDSAVLVARMQETNSWAGRFDLLDAFLLRRMREADPVAPGVVQAARLLGESGGRESVAAVAREVGWSRRHLTLRFQEELGLSPKTFAMILRFERARSLLLAGDMSLAEIAFASGYFDQPHMNRDFRALAGSSPIEYLARRLPDGGGIAGDLPFVQDAVAAAA